VPLAPLDALADSTYVSLTTFRKNGEPVATPVWVARDGDALVVITESDSGKIKRLRNNASVLLATCDMRGHDKGEAYGGTACVLEGDDALRVRSLISGKYKLTYRVMLLSERMRRKRSRATRVGIKITLND